MPPTSILILGPWATGKSWFAASVRDVVGRTLLLATNPKEVVSRAYSGFPDEDKVPFHDPKWSSTLKTYEGDSYIRFLRKLWQLQEDELYSAVIVDDADGLETIIEHEILKPLGVGSSGELADTWNFYKVKKSKFEEAYSAICTLATEAVKKPKYVIVVGHTQPAKDEVETVKLGQGQYATKASSDKRAAGIEYEGRVLMAMEGQLKRTIPKEFLNIVFSDVRYRTELKPKPHKVPEYVIQLVPDEDRHARVDGTTAEGYVANNFAAFLEAMVTSS